MDVITTHVNADFDAFGSMVAAKKLYPSAVVSFPGSQEKSLRDFFMESTLYILSIERAKTIDLDRIKRLILVDTRQKSRIGRFASLLESGSVEVHVYDHHPDSEDDVKGDLEVIRDVGATVTILAREIRERGIDINAEEATVLAIGIYEDTGSFTFSSTTTEDLEAAAWLLSKGANLNIVSDMMTNDLSKDQIEVLHQLIEETRHLNIGGLEIVVTTASVNGYVGDVAVLVHKYRDMENPDAIFALVRMEDRVHLVARSRSEAVNAGDIAAEFGGGGHPSAASATIKHMSLYEARERLTAFLHLRVQPKRTAGQVMSKPVITVAPEVSLGEAVQLLGRYKITSLPVVSNGAVVGILNRNALEGAVHHGLDALPASEYMDPTATVVSSSESIDKVVAITVGGGQRLVPVVDEGSLVGVISRSDLLEHMKIPRKTESGNPSEVADFRTRFKNIRSRMEEILPERVLSILKKAGHTASARGEDVYLVGGAVRDLLLRNRNLDLDLVVEGEGIPFAKEFGSVFPGSRVRCHEKFGTAVIRFEDGFKIDVATARYEYYDSPGALPVVETSSIKRDLFRRDFTVNTLAVSLNPKTFGRVTDFFGGSRDIKEKVIRVLHNLAFVEDPTRILRAVRFSGRFGFSVGRHSAGLMKSAITMRLFDRVDGKRLLNELIHILEERDPPSILKLMDQYGIFEALHPALVGVVGKKDLVTAVTGVLSWWKYLFAADKVEPWLVYFLAITTSLDDIDFARVLERFSVAPWRTKTLLRDRQELKTTLADFSRGALDKPSSVYRALRGFSMEALLFLMARTARERTRQAVSEYIIRLRHVRPMLAGDDLIAMGYVPGPVFQGILGALIDARLDGELKTLEDENRMVLERFQRDPDDRGPGVKIAARTGN
ncbi:MAG: CBS domain-containing protein [Pseudomonadota bacterium]